MLKSEMQFTFGSLNGILVHAKPFTHYTSHYHYFGLTIMPLGIYIALFLLACHFVEINKVGLLSLK